MFHSPFYLLRVVFLPLRISRPENSYNLCNAPGLYIPSSFLRKIPGIVRKIHIRFLFSFSHFQPLRYVHDC